ncbi:MAG TPA: hypothetical protein VKQ32_24660 [Polyangia bacterium]|nr:hypothetical protein [Polyangia bacterium]
MSRIRVLAFVVMVAVFGGAARPAAAASDTAHNVLIGALIGAGIGLVVGIIVYLVRDKPPQPSAATRNPPSWAAVGLAPLPLAAPVRAGRETPFTPPALLTF